MSQAKTFKLIVQVSDACLELLRYVNKNIGDVNKLGARVAVEKISKNEMDEDMIEMLRKKGITRLPALIAPDGKVFIGLKKIMDLFEKNLNNARNSERVSASDGYDGPAADSEIGSNPDLNNFWQQELYAGMDRKGKMIPRKDKDEDEGESADIEKRMSDYRRNVPKHRRTGGRERDIEQPTRERRRHHEDPPSDDDNIADSEDEGGYDEPEQPKGRAPRLPSTGDSRGDDMDQRMLAAWMANNAPE